MDPSKEHKGAGKVKEYVPGTQEYKEKFGYGPPERGLAHIKGTKEYEETEGGKKVDQMPSAERSIASAIPGTRAHAEETGDQRTFTQAIGDSMRSVWQGGKETMSSMWYRRS